MLSSYLRTRIETNGEIMANNLRRIGVRLVLLLAVLAVAASAAPITVNVGTNNGLWNIIDFGSTYLGPAGVAADVVSGNGLTVTSTSYMGGTPIAGGTFNGFWAAEFSFTLPVGFSTPSLTFSGLYADDRAVLELNPAGGFPAVTANSGVIGNTTWLQGTGTMDFTSGCTVGCSYSFTGANGAGDAGNFGTVTSGFVTGTNYIVLIVNNTDSTSLSSRTVGLQNTGSQTVAAFSGSLSYTAPTSVPEPETFSYLLLGMIPVAYRLARRRAR
jgi:hypothetical protein